MNSGFIARMVTVLLLCVSATPGWAQADPVNVPVKEVQIAATSFFLADPVPAWVEPAAIPEGNKKAPLVVRLADTQLLVTDAPIEHVHRAVMVNDAAALTAAGQLAIAFVPEYQRLHLHMVRVLRDHEVLDRTSSSTVRFLQRETGLEQGMYSGVVTASVLVDDLRVGDTLEFAYSIEGQNPVFGGKFADTVVWDQPVPTALRRVVLNYPVSRQLSWRRIGNWRSGPLAPAESTVDGMRKLRFEEESVAEASVEPSTPPDYVAYRGLQFSEFAGWDDVVAWAGGLFQSEGVHDDELRQFVGRLRALATDDERVSAALEFVQSQIRYFSVSLGENSHRPAAPDIVIKRRYGDCKDKSLLLMSLLKEVGIESSPVLVKLGRRKALQNMLPAPQLFDHVIVKAMVDGRAFYLDPTRLGQHGHLSRMGQTHEGAQVLVIAPGVREYSTILTPNIDDLLRNEVTETAVLPKLDADADFRVHQVWSGAAAETARVLFERLPRDRLTKVFGDALETRYPGARLTGEPQIEDDRNDNVLSVTVSYIVPKFATEKNGAWLVRFTPPNLAGALVTPASAVRTAPLTVPRFPYAAKYSIEAKFPEEVSVVTDPTVTDIEDKYFSYTVSESFRGNIAKTSIDFKTLASEVAAADIQKYAQDIRAANNTRSAFVVPNGSIKSADPATANGQDFVQLLRNRLQDVVNKTTETISSGKLSGKDLAESHCLRSGAYADLGRRDDAMRDANQALKLAPNNGKVLLCRAYVYFNTGEFGKAVADYSTAIALGSTEPRIFYMRGMSNFYAGELDDAASDLSRASAADDNDSRLYSELWLSWTLQRLGRPVPEAVTRQAAADPRGDWPRPALAMINGKLAPDDMLKLLDAKSGDERRMALAEGYFYLGQHYLLLGDKAKAQECFEKTRQLDVIIYTEHTAAGFELRRLNGSH